MSPFTGGGLLMGVSFLSASTLLPELIFVRLLVSFLSCARAILYKPDKLHVTNNNNTIMKTEFFMELSFILFL
jgi:hypothetical protein